MRRGRFFAVAGNQVEGHNDAMKLPRFVSLLILLCLCACSGTKLEQVKLPSGDSIGVLGVTTMHFSNGPPALLLKYQTDKPINDTAALRKQAEEVWTQFRPQVERQGLKNAILSANDPPRGFIVTSNSTYNFVFDQRPDGSWHCSYDDKKQPGQ